MQKNTFHKNPIPHSIDLNCDMGELMPGANINFDDEIMPYISSCNISCAFHSGSPTLIEKTITSALKHKVAIGAHPSYNDRANFGRKSLDTPLLELIPQLRYQIAAVKGMAESLGGKLHHVKAHGSLYNDMIKDDALAEAYVQMIKSIDPQLKILGFAESNLAAICSEYNVKFIHEVFADRRYANKNALRSRQHSDAVLSNKESVIKQVSHFLEGRLIDHNGQNHSIKAMSICLHSDTQDAVSLAKEIHTFIKTQGIAIHPTQ